MPHIRPSAALCDLLQEILVSDGLDDAFGALDRRLRRLLPFDSMSVFLTRGGRLAPAYSSGGPCARRRFHSTLAVPLDSGAEAVGVLTLHSMETGVFEPADLGVLLWIRAELARALKHAARPRPRTESLDPLTGLPDGRAALARLDAEVSRSRAAGARLGVLVCALEDADIRSRYGERAWRRLVQSIGAGLRRTCRDSDMVARADEEFVVTLPGLTSSDLEAKQASAAALAEGIGLAHLGERIIPLRSGAALFPEDAGSARELLAAARAHRMAGPSQRVLTEPRP